MGLDWNYPRLIIEQIKSLERPPEEELEQLEIHVIQKLMGSAEAGIIYKQVALLLARLLPELSRYVLLDPGRQLTIMRDVQDELRSMGSLDVLQRMERYSSLEHSDNYMTEKSKVLLETVLDGLTSPPGLGVQKGEFVIKYLESFPHYADMFKISTMIRYNTGLTDFIPSKSAGETELTHPGRSDAEKLEAEDVFKMHLHQMLAFALDYKSSNAILNRLLAKKRIREYIKHLIGLKNGSDLSPAKKDRLPNPDLLNLLGGHVLNHIGLSYLSAILLKSVGEKYWMVE